MSRSDITCLIRLKQHFMGCTGQHWGQEQCQATSLPDKAQVQRGNVSTCLVRLRQQLVRSTGQHPQQLLEGQEGGALLEGHMEFFNAPHIRDHGGIVVGEEPGPRGYTPVVVLQDPMQALYEGMHNFAPANGVVFVHS